MGLVVIDAKAELSAEWHVIARMCQPRAVAILNTNPPRHPGWIAAALVACGWREVAGGSMDGSIFGAFPHFLADVMHRRAWVILARPF